MLRRRHIVLPYIPSHPRTSHALNSLNLSRMNRPLLLLLLLLVAANKQYKWVVVGSIGTCPPLVLFHVGTSELFAQVNVVVYKDDEEGSFYYNALSGLTTTSGLQKGGMEVNKTWV